MDPIRKKGKRVILALEMVQACDKPFIDRYLLGTLTEAGFLKAIGFYKNWGFPWENYRQLFHFAKEMDIEIIGINAPGGGRSNSLNQRDFFAATHLAQKIALDPKAFVFVVAGDLHVAQNHLPKLAKKQLQRLGIEKKVLIIHQNNETLHWKLSVYGMENLADVIKLKEGLFCVMNTSPWIKLRSHINWLENQSSKSPVARHFGQAQPLPDEFDVEEEVLDYIQIIQKFLGFDQVIEDEFHVCSPTDITSISKILRAAKLTDRENGFIGSLIPELESFFVPKGNIIFLASRSPNHIATQATIFLYTKINSFQRLFLHPQADFYPYVWIEAMGYFGSKIINPRRKCTGLRDLKHFLGLTGGEEGEENILLKQKRRLAKLSLPILENPGKKIALSLPHRPSISTTIFYYRMARLLGRVLGEGFYRSVIDGSIPTKSIERLFQTPFEDSDRAQALYLNWTKILDKHGYRTIEKNARL